MKNTLKNTLDLEDMMITKYNYIHVTCGLIPTVTEVSEAFKQNISSRVRRVSKDSNLRAFSVLWLRSQVVEKETIYEI